MDRASVRGLAWILAACLAGCTSVPRPEGSETITLAPPPKPDPDIAAIWEYNLAIPETLVRFDLVRLPAGRIRMGSPGFPSVREVDLKPFWIGKREVTWEEFVFYYACPITEVDGRSTPSIFAMCLLAENMRQPATHLRWHSAMAYCRWLSRRTGHLFRLPTEAEWEHACRAGSDRPAPEPLAEHAWFSGNSEKRLHLGGLKKPNAFGLHDMLGNVWEYCLEPHRPPDFGPALRGGGWDSPAADLRADRRQTIQQEWSERDPNRPRSGWWLTDGFSQGFRLVRVADASDARERESYASRIEIHLLKSEEKRIGVESGNDYFIRVWGRVRNTGYRTLDELHLLVYCLNMDGKPYMNADSLDRPAFTYCFPVLVHSAHPGGQGKPLGPGETRDFTADILDPWADQISEKKGARVTGIVFARE